MKSKNELVAELDAQDLLHILTAVNGGDFSKRLPDNYIGLEGMIADTLNSIIQKNALLTRELKRIGKEVENEGKVRQNISFEQGKGDWSETVEAVNGLVGNLLFTEDETGTGKVSDPIVLKRVSGTWRDLKDDLNFITIDHT
jgi:hypothetical protein